MDYKLDVDRLSKEEITYELKIRGYFEDGTAEKLRKDLRIALKAEKNKSFLMPEYPYEFSQDLDALKIVIAELQSLIDQFVGNRCSSKYKKIETKLGYAFGRLDRCIATEDAEKKKKSELVLKLTKLETEIQDKLEGPRKSSPIKTQHLDFSLFSNVNNSDSPVSETEISDNELIERVNVKPIPVVHWKLKFSGDQKGMTVHGFLERVEELRIARNISRDQLFRSAVDLFEGPALIWYRANRQYFLNWDHFVNEFKKTFLPPCYEEKLYEEIKRRTQGKDENIAVYVSIMTSLFSRLPVKMPEETRVHILMKNIAPFYQQQLALTEIKTVTDLVKLCQRLEEKKAAIENFAPPPRRFETIEADLAYIEQTVASMSTDSQPTSSPKRDSNYTCWNCKKPGHIARNCRAPKRRYCFKCKEPDVTVRTCRKCNPGNETKM